MFDNRVWSRADQRLSTIFVPDREDRLLVRPLTNLHYFGAVFRMSD
jgi:hypothetical protein